MRSQVDSQFIRHRTHSRVPAVIVTFPPDATDRVLTEVRRAMFESVSALAARAVVIDMGAVDIVDSQVAEALVSLARGAQALGAKPVLARVQPGAATVLVELDVDRRGFLATSTVEEALELVERLRGSS